MVWLAAVCATQGSLLPGVSGASCPRGRCLMEKSVWDEKLIFLAPFSRDAAGAVWCRDGWKAAVRGKEKDGFVFQGRACSYPAVRSVVLPESI